MVFLVSIESTRWSFLYSLVGTMGRFDYMWGSPEKSLEYFFSLLKGLCHRDGKCLNFSIFWTIPYSTCSVLLKFWIFPHLGPIEIYFYFLPMPWKSNALQKFEPNFEETWQPFILWQAAAKSIIWKCMKTNAYCVTISKTLFIINLNFCSLRRFAKRKLLEKEYKTVTILSLLAINSTLECGLFKHLLFSSPD